MPFLNVRLGQRLAVKPSFVRDVVKGAASEPGDFVFDILAFAATLAATAFGFVTARRFVRERLKFVDAAQTWRAPLIGGLVAWAVAVPVVWLAGFILPFSAFTAVLFGASVALGTRAGAKDIRMERRLNPGQV